MTKSPDTDTVRLPQCRGKAPIQRFSILSGGLAALLLLLSAWAVFEREGDRKLDQPPPVMFETSATCLSCHNGLVTPSGEDVSIGADWRGSMMANSARDPYWQAAVRRETIDHPPAAAAIENECSTCHMPMAHYRARLLNESAQVFAHFSGNPTGVGATQDAVLASDGVGCAMCHQITGQNFGTPESFVGGFVIDAQTPIGIRSVYGPFDVDSGRSRIMQSATGFVPKQGAHIQESEMCASCHTLITHAMNENHEVVGELPEQVPYLEWLHSDYANTQSCQSCHMPIVPDSVAVSSVLGLPRAEVNQHAFRGGNFLMPRIFAKFGQELGVEAAPNELQGAIDRTVDHLQSNAAAVLIERVDNEEGRLTAGIMVTNQAGHKLPTAYPSRRVWLHLTVLDRDGNVVFESGRLNDDGSIVGNDNDMLEGAYEPHHQSIGSAEQVQIYEAIMVDPVNEVTTSLTSGLRFVKDNRVPPNGFDKATAKDNIAVQGLASDDQDFTGGSDRVRLDVAVDAAAAPFRLAAELWYQPVGYRWAENLVKYDALETKRFAGYYKSLSNASGIILASDSWQGSPPEGSAR